MKPTASLGALILLIGLLAQSPALAEERPSRVTFEDIDAGGFPRVEVRASVLDRVDVPVLGLAARHFELIEDGQTVPIDTVERVRGVAAETVLVLGLDASGSMLAGGALQTAAAVLDDFIDRTAPADQVAVVRFGANCQVDGGPGLTGDKAALRAFVGAARAQGNTPLWEATLRAVQIASGARPGRRLVIMLTDGEETCDRQLGTPAAVVDASTRAGVPVYLLGLGQNLQEQVLRGVAAATGGEYIPVATADRLGAVYDDLLERLRTQYVIRYTSEQYADRQSHSLILRVVTDSGDASQELRFTPPDVEPVLRLSVNEGQRIDQKVLVRVSTEQPVRLVKADFYLDGGLLTEKDRGPLEYPLDPAGRAGSHTLTIRVTDSRGEVTSESVRIEFPGLCIGPVCFSPWIVVAVILSLPIVAIIGVFARPTRSGLRRGPPSRSTARDPEAVAPTASTSTTSSTAAP